MFDAAYEDLLVTYLAECDRYEKAVKELLLYVRDRKHVEFQATARLTRTLALELEKSYAVLRDRRLASFQS